MSLEKFRMAVATNKRDGLEDTVAEVFGRANTFTIVDIDNNEVKSVEVIQNPAVSYDHGAGPIVVKMLVDSGVNLVIGAELGPGASSLLEQHNVTGIITKPGTRVNEAVTKALSEIKK